MLGKMHNGVWARRIAILVLAAPLLVACDSMPSLPAGTASLTEKPLGVNGQDTHMAVFSAALTPLEDIGLRKRKIPDMLKMLADNPYTPPDKVTCDEVKKEMADLTVLLGPDMGTPKKALTAQEAMMEDGGNLLQDAVVGLVKSQTDIIPLRSIVRRLTGAQSHEKAVNRAVEAGKLRRAYLRGLADGKYGIKCIPKVVVITAEAETESKDKTDPESEPDSEAVEIAQK